MFSRICKPAAPVVKYSVMYIEFKDVQFQYVSEEGEAVKEALKGLNFGIEKGSFVALVGHNGSGKSTLAKHFNALLIPTGGDVLIDGMNTKDESVLWDIRSKCGMVFQNPDNQLVSSIVEDDVAFGPENLGVEPSEIRRRVDEALKAVDMYEHRKKGPHLLSGGQKQRIAIAGVLAMQPEIIVFDEPTAMLDPRGRTEIMNIINQLHDEGKTIILVTHFMEEAIQADRIICLDHGKIVHDKTPAEVFKTGDVELTFAGKLAKKLREKGMNIPDDIFTEDKLEEYLCSLK